MTGGEDRSVSALRWRCRRGMRELDVLLGHWLNDCYPDAEQALQQAFSDLLECEDDMIWDWLMGRSAPPDHLQALVAKIQGLSETRSLG